MLNHENLGQRSQPRSHLVERGAVLKFARALGFDQPIYQSREAAQRAGYRDVLTVPTFAVTLLPWDIPGLALPDAGVLHGEQEFEWGEPICVGDVIEVSGWVDEVKSRAGHDGQMSIISILSEGVHSSGAMAFRARSVLIVTEEVAGESRG